VVCRFARWDDGRVFFGVTDASVELTPASRPALQHLLQDLEVHRHPLANDTRHSFHRAQPERRLESIVREDVTRVAAMLDERFVYVQVLSNAGGEHGILDLLAVTRSGRLAIIELKASEHIHLSCGASAAIPSDNGRSAERSLARDGNRARGPCRKLAPRPSCGHAPVTARVNGPQLHNGVIHIGFLLGNFSAHLHHSIGKILSLIERIRTVQATNFSVAIRQAGPISLVDVSGRLTSFEVSALRDAISRLLKQGRKNIVLNLCGLEYLDSSGIGELAKVYVSVVKVNGQLKVVGLSPKVEEILKITQLYQVFPEFPSEEAALQSFPESGLHETV